MDWLGTHKSGQPLDVLEFGSTPHPPECNGKDETLIKVHYTDINALDVQKLVGTREKRADVPDKSLTGSGPMIPGYGGSGIVESCSADPSLVGKPVCFFAPKGGSYASHVVTSVKCVAELPNGVDPEIAAAIPVSGLCALETLAKLGLSRDASVALSKQDGTLQKGTVTAASGSSGNGTQENKSMLIVGASGGVGSWIMTLVKAWHPHMNVIATASKQNEAWCTSLGASKVIGHDEITSKLDPATVDYVICIAEATQHIFNNFLHAIRPYGTIALLVQSKAMNSLNLSSCWTNSVNVVTQSILTAPQTKFSQIVPADELKILVRLVAQQSIQVPLSPDLNNPDIKLSHKFKDALKPDSGLLHRLWSQPQVHPRRGKYTLQITAGDSILFLDCKTGAIVPIPRKDVIARKLLTKAGAASSDPSASPKKTSPSGVWKEEAKLEEKPSVIEKITQSKTLQIVKQVDKQATDFEGGLDISEAENVKNMWGVSLKKREKNKEGEEFMFVDARFGCVGELSRKKSLEKGIITLGEMKKCQVGAAESGEELPSGEVVLEAEEVTEDQRAELIQEIRMGLKIGLD